MTVLVTGATGFLGGSITRTLRERGDPVRALVRQSSRGATVAGLEALGVEVAMGDILDPGSLDRALAGANAVIHCAGVLGRAGANEREYLRTHADGTANVLAACRRTTVQRVLHVGSPGLLGPIAADAPDATEDAHYRPTNVYERAKAAAERVIEDFERAHGPIAVVVRPEFVYGPGDHHVWRLFESIERGRFFYIGRGDAICHPTYIDDATRGMVAAFDRGACGRTYHLAGPRPVTIRELAEGIASALGVKSPRIHVPERLVRLGIHALRPLARIAGRPLPIDESGVDFFVLDRHFSYQRAKFELGFEPKIDIAEGTRRTVAWKRGQTQRS